MCRGSVPHSDTHFPPSPTLSSSQKIRDDSTISSLTLGESSARHNGLINRTIQMISIRSSVASRESSAHHSEQVEIDSSIADSLARLVLTDQNQMSQKQAVDSAPDQPQESSMIFSTSLLHGENIIALRDLLSMQPQSQPLL